MCGSQVLLVLLFFSFSEFVWCIFGVNVIDYKIYKNVIIIRFLNALIFVNIARCPCHHKYSSLQSNDQVDKK